MAIRKKAFGLSREEPVVRTSIRMSQAMADDIATSLSLSGRTSRERSTWLSGIIEAFLADESAPEWVAEEFYECPRGSSVTVSVTLKKAVDHAITETLYKTIQRYGAVKDRSAVVRTAVIAHLLKQVA